MNPETKDILTIFAVYIAVVGCFLLGALVLREIPGGL